MLEAGGFSEIFEWIKSYGASDALDKRAAEEFTECETDEKIKALKRQLYALSQGDFDEEVLDQQIGVKRKARHGSYQQWAKLMLLWIANYYRPS